jgi:hypothetical protein
VLAQLWLLRARLRKHIENAEAEIGRGHLRRMNG